jgi:hypothetical protein
MRAVIFFFVLKRKEQLDMKWHLLMLVLIGFAITSFAKKDSSDIIFDDSRINHYDLTFFTENWTDSLVAHRQDDQSYLRARCVWRNDKGDSMVLDTIGVRYKGNSSYNDAKNSPKKPYKFYFNKYKKDQTFFNLQKLNFGNLVNDPSMMREKITYDLARQYMISPRAVYATISVMGVMIGLFIQVEEVDEKFLTLNFKDDNSNLFKSADEGATLTYKGVNKKDYASEYDLKTNPDDDDWSGLIKMLDKLNNTPDSLGFVKTVNKLLDIDNCLRYMAFDMVNSNFDSYIGSGRNIYLYEDHESDQFKLIPWDFNLAMGNFSNGWNVISVDAFNIPNIATRPLCQKLLGIDSLKLAYGRYIKQMIDGYMNVDSIAKMADRIKPVIDSTVKIMPNNFFGYDTFNLNIEGDFKWVQGPVTTVIPGIKTFPKKRAAALQQQLDRENIAVLNHLPGKTQVSLLQCLPGAFGKTLTLQYSFRKEDGAVSIFLYTINGKQVYSSKETHESSGVFSKSLDIRNLPCGFYTIGVKTDKKIISRGILIAK